MEALRDRYAERMGPPDGDPDGRAGPRYHAGNTGDPGRPDRRRGPRPDEDAPAEVPSAGRPTRSRPPWPERGSRAFVRRGHTLGSMDRRIFGLENEYGVTCTFRGQRRLSPDEVARYLFRRVVHWGRSSNVFLENGARLYLDVGSHPEYATPECDAIRELVAHDKAGERILEHLLSAAEMRLHEEGISGEVYLFKNNTDSAGNSYGCHENYLVARHGEFARMADVLIPFFVTRQIWCGAGKVLHGPRGAQFCIAQRAEHIWEGVSSATTRSRPDHQHPRRAARRRRAVPAAARDRRGFEHERMDDLHEGRDHRPRAPDGRGQHRDARSHAREPDPRDPGDQPRHDVHTEGEAGERPRTLGVGRPDRVLREDGTVRGAARHRRAVRGAPRGVGRGARGACAPANPIGSRGRSTGSRSG